MKYILTFERLNISIPIEIQREFDEILEDGLNVNTPNLTQKINRYNEIIKMYPNIKSIFNENPQPFPSLNQGGW